MREAIFSNFGIEIVILVCTAIRIVFSVFQWVLVSKVKLSLEKPSLAAAAVNKNRGSTESLIEKDEGLNDHNVVQKYAEIHNTISDGEVPYSTLSRSCRFRCL
ncbi:hypothetical protein CsSME_00042107 [Camellia sinensis var. sinensis]